MARSLKEIAAEIRKDWENIDAYALEALEAMESLNTIDDDYIAESGGRVVGTFLGNSSSWSGGTAKRIKAELEAMQRH